jgi:hypothetical protein
MADRDDREVPMKPKLPSIADLIGQEIKPEERKRRKPVVTILSDPLLCPEAAKLPRKYECEVFNFLLENKPTLGIQTVFKFQNLHIDGAIVLADGRRLAVEIKLRMNWTKALQAQMEIRRFLLTSEAKSNPVAGAIIFIAKFQGDGWHRKAKCRFLENGWNHWYANYFKIDGYRADLLRLSDGTLEHYGLAMANSLMANMDQMSDDDKNRLIAAATHAKELP